MLKLSIKSIVESHVIDRGFSKSEVKRVLDQIGFDAKSAKFDLSKIVDGANHEIEHKGVVNSSPSKLIQIALDHLKEDPDYYKKLKEIE
jgi:hypothetical protein